ncbi:MAG: right-handed parallel beta-helix repeat-containing protein [Planctomycetota bacterium]|nr:right-handed parallel beta-helix repeat-containing protein [Planctomycetota bacterium]
MALQLRLFVTALVAAGWFVQPRLHAQGDGRWPASGVVEVRGSLRAPAGEQVRVPQAAAEGEPACAVRIAGLVGAVIDLRGATLRASATALDASQRTGIALYLTDCRDVKLLGGTLAGYGTAVRAERCAGLVLEDLRVEGFAGERLLSTRELPDDADELDRNADGASWLTQHAAAFALVSCEGASIVRCRARGGQNGLVLVDSGAAKVHDNDFSFLSGWGIALHGSQHATIARNRCDFCVRGFSAGEYALGAGSAAILLAGRSRDVLVAENSARCSGDGIVVLSGSDRALLLRNDASSAVRHGLVVADSRDVRARANGATECLGAGLAACNVDELVLADNDVSGARTEGVRLSAVHEATLAGNLLERCGVGLAVNGDRDPRLCGAGGGELEPSRDVHVFANSFSGNGLDLALERTTGLAFGSNIIAETDRRLSIVELTLAVGEAPGNDPRQLLLGLLGRSPSGSVRHSTIRAVPDQLDEVRLARTLAPELTLEGQARPTISAPRLGTDEIVLGEFGPWDPTCGEPRPALRPFGGALTRWRARWFRWDEQHDPRGDANQLEQWRALAEQPAFAAETAALTSPWGPGDAARESVGVERFGLIASGEFETPEAGEWVLRAAFDDGLRVRIDGALALEDWRWQSRRSMEARLQLAAGRHRIEFEYFQIDGAAALALELVRR